MQANVLLFALHPPASLPTEVNPAVQSIHFPPQFEVKTVSQIAPQREQLLILADDERSVAAADPKPDVSTEVRRRHGRIWIVDANGTPRLFEPDALPQNIRWFLAQSSRLWVAGETTGYLDFRDRTFHKFGLNDGLALSTSHMLAIAGEKLFVVGSPLKVFQLDPTGAHWEDVRAPQSSYFLSGDDGFRLTGNHDWLAWSAHNASVYNLATGTWSNLDVMGVNCIVPNEGGFWLGADTGLYFYDPRHQRMDRWPAPHGIQTMYHPAAYMIYHGQYQMSQAEVDQLSSVMERLLIDTEKQTRRSSTNSEAIDPLHLDCRMPANIYALAEDGEFLWLGTESHAGVLLLMHRPSLSLVGCYKTDGRITSLAVTDKDVWAGVSFGTNVLLRIPKAPFLSVPRDNWVSLVIKPDERRNLIRSMPLRSQAVYAFHAGDRERVVDLLHDRDPQKATVEEMFLLAFSYNAFGTDKPELARYWFERIIKRYPDSPWSAAAQKAREENDRDRDARQREASLLARYDHDHDGKLDPSEMARMKQDPAYQQEQKPLDNSKRELQLVELMKRFDRNNDAKLDSSELDYLLNRVRVYSGVPPEVMAGSRRMVAPFAHVLPDTTNILKDFDRDQNGGLDATELKALADRVEPLN
jgi:Ca2+-binding EF-hand superfamily protein